MHQFPCSTLLFGPASRGIAFLCLVGWVMLGQSLQISAQDRTSPTSDRGQADSQQEKLFSGPQKGEPLPELPVWLVSPDGKPSTKVDLAKRSDESPVAIIFLHEKSRPAFQLARLMSAFTAKKKQGELEFYFVVLSEDRSSSEGWLGKIRNYLPNTHLAVADGGIEGPGALGLNRLVAVTVLVAKQRKVTANVALTQATAAVDGPPILQAMNEVSGGGEIPKIEELLPNQQGRARAEK